MNWSGVMPAMTTAFDSQMKVDHTFMASHARWLIENGCTGIVSLGSLGEGGSLTFSEKIAVFKNISAAAGKVPVVAAVSAISTSEAVDIAKGAADAGCSGLMVLPPYLYRGDWREMKAHVTAVFEATPLSSMLYNNPVAYGTDFLPGQIAELATEYETFQAVKESSTDVRRISSIRALLDDRLKLFAGVDDAIVESIGVGVTGWIAGLANALPAESVALFNLALSQKHDQAFEIYRWFLPLLRLDTVPKFVQLIKLVQQELGVGSTRVRPPRLELTGEELVETQRLIKDALKSRSKMSETPFALVHG
jgi:4-hydroxy-tetrahydrodipicolinate synthase